MKSIYRKGDRLCKNLQQEILKGELSRICERGIAGIEEYDIPFLCQIYLQVKKDESFRTAVFDLLNAHELQDNAECKLAFQALVGCPEDSGQKLRAEYRKQQACKAISELREGTHRNKMTTSSLDKTLRPKIVETAAERLSNCHIAQLIDKSGVGATDNFVQSTPFADRVRIYIDEVTESLQKSRETINTRMRSNFKYRVDINADIAEARITYSSSRSLNVPGGLDAYICRTSSALQHVVDDGPFLGVEVADLTREAWLERRDSIVAILFVDDQKCEVAEWEKTDEYVRIRFRPPGSAGYNETTLTYKYPIDPKMSHFPVLFNHYFTCGGAEIDFNITSEFDTTIGYRNNFGLLDGKRPIAQIRAYSMTELSQGSVTFKLPEDSVIWPGSGIDFYWHRRCSGM